MSIFSTLFGKSNPKADMTHILDPAKKTLPEKEISRVFIAMLMEGVQKEWPNISSSLKKLEMELRIPDEDASFEFFIAVLATQIFTLPNFLPRDQAVRMRENLMKVFSPAELGSYPHDTFNEYQRAWDYSPQQGDLPIDGVIFLLCEKLGYKKYQSIIFRLLFTRYITIFCDLKDIVEGYELVP